MPRTTDNFGFKSFNELEDDLNFNKTKACPHCKKPIPEDSLMCLYCGESTYSKTNSWIGWVALFLIICFVLMYIF